jgi:hypothetical protein
MGKKMKSRSVDRMRRDADECVELLEGLVGWCEMNKLNMGAVLTAGLTYMAMQVLGRSVSRAAGRELIASCLNNAEDFLDSKRARDSNRLH